MFIPDPLIAVDGSRIDSKQQWLDNRQRLLRQFEQHQFGETPKRNWPFTITHSSTKRLPALGAMRRQVTLDFDFGTTLDVLQYTPLKQSKPVPAFAMVNFIGNQSIASIDETDVPIQSRHVITYPGGMVVNDRATEASRGARSHYLPVKTLIERGYGALTFCCADVEEDHAQGYNTGVRGRSDWSLTHSGAIGAWAWGLSRVLDYIEQHEPLIDAKRVAVMGHSRMGKTALWAAAQDTRFAMAISNESGQGGAAIHRRRMGETIEHITRGFPHWFCAAHRSFDRREHELPFDSHQLLALIAPRPVYVASAAEDLWADPEGERLATERAKPVFELLGATPPGYHVRPGVHHVEPIDWEHFLDFADGRM
jgi:hypothetical protein